jgi:uncharacterized delta-60 repeat protein
MNYKSASVIDAITHSINHFFMKKILLCFMAIFAILTAHSQAGSLDPSFAGKGWTTTDIKKGNLYNEYNGQVLLQKDTGYIVVFEVNGTMLTRFCRNGATDTKFGTGGYSDPVPIYQSKAALQSDGKIVVAGQVFNTNTGNYDFALARYNSNGSLDNSFDGDGKLTTDFNGSYDIALALTIQTDGKIIVAGQTYNSDMGNYDFALARYNCNGSLDNTFDGDGKLTTDFGSGTEDNDFATSLAIQTDGKILVAGQAFNTNTESYDFALARYNSDGTLDNGFGGNGRQTTDFNSNYDIANSLAIQTNGKIIAAGYTFNPFTTIKNSDFALARYNSDGTLDNTFNGDGMLTTDFNGGNDYAASVAIQTNGKIVVAGQAFNSNTGNYDFALARYNNNESLDNSFDGDGKLTTDFGGYDVAYSLAIQTNGKIVVAGQALNPNTNNNDFALARYNSNGSLDNTFDGDGKLTGFYLSGDTRFTAIALQTDGKIVVAGQALNIKTGNYDFALARYNTDGSLDKYFDKDGKQTTDFFGFDDIAYALAIQADGKIVVAGAAININYDFALARYNSDGSLDNSFDGDGKQTIDFNGLNNIAYALAIQPNGKIVVAGQASDNFALVRYNSNGSLDNSFDGDGKLITDFGSSAAYALAIQTNGKIVVAGQAFNLDNTTDFALARYNSNGSLDNTFDGDGKLTTDFGGYDGVTSLAIQTNGKIVAAGQTLNPNTFNNNFALARYNSNGALDNSFDGDGKLTTDLGSGKYYAASIAIQTNGKIVVAGQAYIYSTDNDFALARYNSNGALDNSFNGDGKLTTDFNGGNDYAAAIAIRNNRIYVVGYSQTFFAPTGIVAAYQTGTTTVAAPAITSIVPLKAPQPITQKLTVSVLPNPSTRYFTLKLQSNENNSTVTVSITDAAGRLIEMKNNVNANSSLQLGHNYPPGIYFAQIVQGNKKEIVKLIKQ